jgi:TonB family protein
MRTIAGLVLATAISGASEFMPVRRVDGALPPMPPPTVVGWLEEMIDLTVDARGVVGDVKTVTATGSSPDSLASAAAAWRFLPATVDGRPVSSHVLAVALIRPPQLFDGPTLGTEPTTAAAASEETPAPTVMIRPRYPPLAVGDSLVLVEVLVGSDGQVHAAAVVEGTSGFNDEALRTAGQWVFRPAHRGGDPVEANVYIAFGFRQPLSQH